MSRTTDLTGKHFGKLTVIRCTGEQEDRYWSWLCRCDCGNEIVVNTRRLTCGVITHCGCENLTKEERGPIPDDLTGKRYGKLTVLCSDQLTGTLRPSWLCRCDCGNECYVTAYTLFYGFRKSCGCLQKKADTGEEVNLIGQTFGALTVTGRVIQRDGSVQWKCLCGCGSEISVMAEELLRGKCRSCGCIEQGTEQPAASIAERPEQRKSRSDNTSGFRGVSRHPDGRWLVSIGLKSRRYYIGLFADYDEAVRARLRMEEILQKGYEETYQNWQTQAQMDSAWAEAHPFYYNVAKNGRYFQIQTVFGSTTVSAV